MTVPTNHHNLSHNMELLLSLSLSPHSYLVPGLLLHCSEVRGEEGEELLRAPSLLSHHPHTWLQLFSERHQFLF